MADHGKLHGRTQHATDRPLHHRDAGALTRASPTGSFPPPVPRNRAISSPTYSSLILHNSSMAPTSDTHPHLVTGHAPGARKGDGHGHALQGGRDAGADPDVFWNVRVRFAVRRGAGKHKRQRAYVHSMRACMHACLSRRACPLLDGRRPAWRMSAVGQCSLGFPPSPRPLFSGVLGRPSTQARAMVGVQPMRESWVWADGRLPLPGQVVEARPSALASGHRVHEPTMHTQTHLVHARSLLHIQRLTGMADLRPQIQSFIHGREPVLDMIAKDSAHGGQG